MSKFKPVGPGGNGTGRVRGDAGRTQKRTGQTGARGSVERGRARETEDVDRSTFQEIDRIDPRSLPAGGIAGKESPLTGVLWSGVRKLAELNGWEGPQDPLSMLMSALGMTEAPEHAFTQDSRKTEARQFGTLGFDKDAAAKLVDLLAFVVAGLYTDPGSKKSARETKIREEVDKNRKAIADILKTPTPEREAAIARLGEALLGKANQLGVRTNELSSKDKPEILQLIENRVRAVFDIVNIVSKQAFAAPKA